MSRVMVEGLGCLGFSMYVVTPSKTTISTELQQNVRCHVLATKALHERGIGLRVQAFNLLPSALMSAWHHNSCLGGFQETGARFWGSCYNTDCRMVTSIAAAH